MKKRLRLLQGSQVGLLRSGSGKVKTLATRTAGVQEKEGTHRRSTRFALNVLSVIAVLFALSPSAQAQCEYALELHDTYGDGWNGNTIDVEVNGITTNYTLSSGTYISIPVVVNTNDSISLTYNNVGSWQVENAFFLYDADGDTIYYSGYDPSPGLNLDTTALCPPCPKPTTLAATGVTSTSVDLSWVSTASGYIVEWGPQGFTTASGTATTSNSSITVTGLSPHTMYEFRITADCSLSGNGFSTPASITVMTAIAAGWAEGFGAGYPSYGMAEGYGQLSDSTVFTSNSSMWYNATDFGNVSGSSNCVAENLYSSGRHEWTFTYTMELDSGSTYIFEYDVKWTEYNDIADAVIGTDDTIYVVISTDNGTTWSRSNILQGYHLGNPVTSAGKHELIPLTGYEGLVRIGFYATSTVSNADTDFFLDNLELNYAPNCLQPYNFTTNFIGTDSINFSFSGDSLASGFKIEWGPCGYSQGTGSVLSTTNDTIGLSGLSPMTCYDIYLMSYCGTDSSFIAGPFTVYTACDTLGLPWIEGFEAGLNYPQCWSNESSSTFYQGIGTGPAGNPGPYSGSNYLYHQYSFGNEWWSFTPEFFLRANKSYQVSFWYQTEAASVFDEVALAYGPGASSGNMIYPIKSETGVSSATYVQFIATFIPIADGIYNIGLMTKNSGFSGTIDIDDIQVILDPNPCATAGNPLSTATSDSSIAVSWGSIPSHTSFQVEWGPSGFTPATGMGRMINGLTSNTVLIDTLADNACYDFYVRAVCGTDTGSWVGPATTCTPCLPATLPYTEDFTVWPPSCVDPLYGTQGWVSYSSDWAEASFWSYNDIDFKMKMNNVVVDTIARVTFDWSHTFDSFYPEDQLALFARVLGTTTWDTLWNKVGADLHSNDGSGNTVPGSGAPVSILLDSAAYYNQTVEFVFYAYSGFGPDVFVDNFVVEAVPSCVEPSNFAFISSSDNSAFLSFTSGGSSNFNVSVGPSPSTTSPNLGTILNFANDTVNVTSLLPNTEYVVWVRDSCGPGDVSPWTGPLTFRTACLPYSAPYMESFNTWPPSCIEVDLGGEDWASYSGWAEASFWSYNNVHMIMNSPMVILTDTSELSFMWSHLYSTFYPLDGLEVRVKSVSESAWTVVWSEAGASFNSNDGAGNTAPGSGVVEYITLPNYGPGDTIVVQFDATSGFGPDAFVDNISIHKAPACAAPSALGATNITSTTADVFWTEGTAGASTWYVEYGLGNFALGSGTSVTALNDTFALTSLMPATQYCYYLTEICPNGVDSSTTVGPFCFSTACPPVVSAPYGTDFENVSAGQVGITSLENCWTMNGVFFAPAWETEDASGGDENSLATGPNYDHTQFGTVGGMYLFLETSGGSIGDTASVWSPWVDVSSLTLPQIEFWYHMFGVNMGNLYIDVRDNDMTWNRVDSIIGQQQTAGSDPWMIKSILLTGSFGDTIQIRFVGERGNGFESDMSIDDVGIVEAPSCPSIYSVTFANATATGADASWTATVTGQTYEIEYGGSGFTPGTGTTVTSPSPSYSFTGLPQNLVSEMYLRPICAPGDTGLWTGPFTIEILPVPCDDFEDYSPGLIDPQSVLVNGWAGSGGDAEVMTFGGSQALHIYTAGTNAFSDVVLETGVIDTGIWVAQFDFQLAPGAGGYYNILHSYTGSTNVWAIEVYLDTSGTATVNGGTNLPGVLGTYTFNPSGWNTIEHHIDLDNDTAWIVVNGVAETWGWQFSLGSFNMADQFNALNFYSAANTGQVPDYYVDNFCLTEVCALPTLGITDVQLTANDSIAVYDFTANSTNADSVKWDFGGGIVATGEFVTQTYTLNGSYSITVTAYNDCGDSIQTVYNFDVEDISIEENALTRSLNVYPNPSEGNFNLTFDLPRIAKVELQVVNTLGQVVHIQDLGEVQSFQGQVDLSEWPKGVYLLKLSTGESIAIQRITVY